MPQISVLGRAIEVRMIPAAASGCPTLVFLHEGLGSVSLWRDFPDQVACRLGAPAIVYSRAGYGQSAALHGPRTPAFMHDEALLVLPALLATLGIEKPVLIGHSDGASIALIHASNAQHSTSAVVLMAPHVFVEPCTVENIARVTEAYETSNLKSRLARHHVHVDDAFLGWSRIWLDPRFRTWNLAKETQNLRVPTLLIQGEDDEYGSLAQLDAIAEIAPGPVQRLILANCGHSPQRDQPAAVLGAIATFLARTINSPASAPAGPTPVPLIEAVYRIDK